ncbi:DUF5819 family protein [Promicromonospora sp. NPDC090134]|uniref:DUF5819 family protein n=1 Tax=Promicromonospora sp. NPDC090134 TaxID=3364408 RepID=UPI0038203ECF
MSSTLGDRDTRHVLAEPPEPPEPPAVSGRARGIVVAVWVVLFAHLVATFVWAAPGYLTGRPSGESTGDVPTTAVHRALEVYLTPVFAQNWSVFAPSPLHVEYSLRVRGIYAGRPGADLVPGPWIDATAVEARALTGHVLPAATERPSRRLATELRTAFLELPEDGRAALLVSPVAADTPAEPLPVLRAALLDAGGVPDVVDDYLGKDRAVTAYATQVLRASGDDAVPVYVQASILRQEVARQGSGARHAPSELVLGARPPVVVPGQDDAAFRRTWTALRGDVVGEGEPGDVGPVGPEPTP